MDEPGSSTAVDAAGTARDADTAGWCSPGAAGRDHEDGDVDGASTAGAASDHRSGGAASDRRDDFAGDHDTAHWDGRLLVDRGDHDAAVIYECILGGALFAVSVDAGLECERRADGALLAVVLIAAHVLAVRHQAPSGSGSVCDANTRGRESWQR
ncbi:hypothetical protein [Tsukamurella pulmonis]|uniref:hypothetical protein n=1 Tax=Tsukamurella pulmonis TaxID=47312 RepID=UPI001113B6A1|nr:hypothetical protein [Tsukamurella pulmonis]